MAIAGVYKPIGKGKVSVNNKNRVPVEIIRCVDSEGNYVLVKKYESGGRKSNLRSRRRHNTPVTTYEHEPCKLDMPAEFKLPTTSGASYADKNEDYQIQTINYYLDKQNINEYELRNLIMAYLKSKRKEMDKDKFKIVCGIFDKADKMLGRADHRKNVHIHEANVSYSFLIRSYKRVVELCEVKKKVAEDYKDTSFSLYRQAWIWI